MKPPKSPAASALVHGHRTASFVFGVLSLCMGFLLPGDAATALLCEEVPVDEDHDIPRVVYTTCLTVRVGALVSYFVGMASLHHLMACTVFASAYSRLVEEGKNYFRWFEYCCTSSIMVFIMGILVGMRNLYTLLLLGAMQICCLLFGAIWETQSRNAIRSNIAHYCGWFPFFVEWGLLLNQCLATARHAPEAVDKFSFVVVAVQFVLFSAFGVVQFLQVQRLALTRRAETVEAVYLVLSVVTKSTMACCAYFAQMHDPLT